MSNDSNQNQPIREQSTASDPQADTTIDRRPAQKQPIHTAPTPVAVRRPPEPAESVESPETVVILEEKSSAFSELVKFGILAVILLGVPLVIALLNPIIFGQIVPAVLGSNLPQNAPTLPGDQVIQPPTAETPNVVLPTDPQTGIGGEATPTPLPALATPTEPEPIFHIVRSGETLNAIARQYGITAADITNANNLSNPNQIFSGQILEIPVQSNPYP